MCIPSISTRAHALAAVVFFLIKESKVFQITISGHLAQRRKSRDADSRFTRELFQGLGNAHSLLVILGNL
jgi:hypothetical protein